MPVVVVFACVHNAGRSQMAAAFFNAVADPARARAISAGTHPGERVHAEVAEAMGELGLDLSGARPRLLTPDLAAEAAWLVTMGCGEQCPVVPGVARDDWPLPDPKGRPMDEVRRIRDEVRRRVEAFVDENGWSPAPLEDRLRALHPGLDDAPIALLVRRLPKEGRETPDVVMLDPERGVVGDKWGRAERPDLEAQVTLMRWDVAAVLHPRPAILGDNLFAAIDTSAANLPPGTILAVGAARCVVTPKAHTGCHKFAARAGQAALALTRSPAWVGEQLRGVHLRVLEGGEVRLGDRIRVVSRG